MIALIYLASHIQCVFGGIYVEPEINLYQDKAPVELCV